MVRTFKFWQIVINILLIACLLVIFFKERKNAKVGYVRSQIIIDQFIGTKNAKQVIQGKVMQWQSQIDSLQENFNKEVEEFEKEYANYNSKKKQDEQLRLEQRKVDLERYLQVLNEKVKNENEILSQGALNQINSYIKKYGEENGYDIILGTTMDGSVLYGNDKVDLTEEIIKGINSEYK